MIRDDAIYLVDAAGKERMVYCSVRSVRMSEAYKAKEFGLNPTVVFVLSDFIEYADEPLCRWGTKYYSIVRAYVVDKAREGRVSGRELELVCEERAFFGPHTVTLYNVREDPATFARSVAITILPGVFFQGTTGTNADLPAIRPNDLATLRIPFSVPAKDALTGAERTYSPARAWTRTKDRSGLWTLDVSRDFFVKGEVIVESGELQELRASADDVFMVRTVTAKDTEPEILRYWEVSGSKWRSTYA